MIALSPINISQLKQIDMGELQKAPRELTERMRQAELAMYREPIIPNVGVFAEVKVNGKTIAKVSNSGGVETSNAFGSEIAKFLANNNTGPGPEGALRTAQALAEAYNGEVVKAPTAKTQAEWLNREPKTWKLNTERLERHGHEVPKELEGINFSSVKLANETLGTLLDYSEI